MVTWGVLRQHTTHPSPFPSHSPSHVETGSSQHTLSVEYKLVFHQRQLQKKAGQVESLDFRARTLHNQVTMNTNIISPDYHSIAQPMQSRMEFVKVKKKRPKRRNVCMCLGAIFVATAGGYLELKILGGRENMEGQQPFFLLFLNIFHFRAVSAEHCIDVSPDFPPWGNDLFTGGFRGTSGRQPSNGIRLLHLLNVSPE